MNCIVMHFLNYIDLYIQTKRKFNVIDPFVFDLIYN